MKKQLIGLGAILLTLAACTATMPTAALAPVPWEADESTLPAIAPLEGEAVAATTLPWETDASTLPAIAPVEAFSDYDMLPN